jgi:tetratricopeptide (TPR) repeat protein
MSALRQNENCWPRIASPCLRRTLSIILYTMKRPQLVSKGTLDRLLNTAEEKQKDRDFQACTEILERASRLDPGNPILLFNLGHACGKRFDYSAAQQAFERAIRISPRKAEAFAAAGLRANDFGNQKLAEHYYRLAAAQKDATPEALVALAGISERQSRLEEAAQLIDQALRLKPKFPPALLTQARLERQAGRLAEAEAILKSFAADADRNTTAQAHYELGAILDRQGRYDEAMTAFLKAKSVLAQDAAMHSEQLRIMRTKLKDLRESLTADLLKRWHEQIQKLQPARRLALLCGHPRSGTTLLEQVIDSHPEIISAEETEIFHDAAYMPLIQRFPSEQLILTYLDSADPMVLRKSRENYFRTIELFLGETLGNRLLVDKNPSLTFLMSHFIRVFPEVKFIVALRDPRDVCMSCFMQPLPLNQTAAAYLTMESTVEDYRETMTMYQTVAERMENERIEVRYEDMVNDLETVARRVLNFLNVPWNEQVLRFHEHAQQKIVRSPTYADVTRPVFKRAVGRWHHYEKYLSPHLDKLAPFVKAFGYE